MLLNCAVLGNYGVCAWILLGYTVCYSKHLASSFQLFVYTGIVQQLTLSGYQRVKPFVLVTGLQSGSSTNSGGGGTQSTSSNLSQHLTYTSYILKQTPQVSSISILIEAVQFFRLQWISPATLASFSSVRYLLYHLLIAICTYLHLTSPYRVGPPQGLAPCGLRK